MKRILGRLIFALCFSVLFLTSCQQEEQAPERVDLRDLYVGNYICDVMKKNYITEVIVDSYQDTLEIVKQGEDKLVINNTRYIQVPEVKYMENGNHSMYVTLATIVVFNKENLNIYYGHGSAFYEFTGIRKR